VKNASRFEPDKFDTPTYVKPDFFRKCVDSNKDGKWVSPARFAVYNEASHNKFNEIQSMNASFFNSKSFKNKINLTTSNFDSPSVSSYVNEYFEPHLNLKYSARASIPEIKHSSRFKTQECSVIEEDGRFDITANGSLRGKQITPFNVKKDVSPLSNRAIDQYLKLQKINKTLELNLGMTMPKQPNHKKKGEITIAINNINEMD
jgi:hypothetical protein